MNPFQNVVQTQELSFRENSETASSDFREFIQQTKMLLTRALSSKLILTQFPFQYYI